MDETAGIVVLGTPRSGTTLLRRILDAHPAIACPPETYVLSAAARFLHEERFAAGLRIGVLVGLGYAGLPEDEVLARLRAFVFDLLKTNAERQGKPRWAEKTAFDAFHVANIRRVCEGHVKFVCVQRHGLDVACSLEDLVAKTGGYVQELHAYVQRHPDRLQAFAHAWVDTATAVADLADQDENALSIRYEDLVRDPEDTARTLFEFVGEPMPDGLLDRALAEADRVGFGDWKTYARSSIDASSVDRWRALPRSSIESLAEICNPTLQRLGHDAVDIGEIDDVEARRRYELGLWVNRMKAQRKQETPAPDDATD
jgi:hypothetical protein